MQKITMITGSLPPIKCGVGYYSSKLLKGLSRTSLQVSVITSVGTQPLGDMTSIAVDSWKIRNVPRIIKQIKKTSPDIIHIQYPAVGYGRRLGINILPYIIRLVMPGVGLIITLHEYSASRLVGRLRNLVTILPAKQLIVSNEADRLALKKIKRSTSIIPIGGTIAVAEPNGEYYRLLFEKAGFDIKKPTLVFFGFPHRSKRLELLIGSIKNEGLADFQLLLLTSLTSKNEYEAMLIKMIDEINQDKKRIYITGFLPENEVSILLQCSKYFILPQDSPVNGKSTTAIAAVVHGLILFGTAASNPRDSLPYIHKKNSYLLDSVNKGSITNAVLDVYSASDLQQKIMRGAEELAKYFSWDNIIDRHKEIYSNGSKS